MLTAREPNHRDSSGSLWLYLLSMQFQIFTRAAVLAAIDPTCVGQSQAHRGGGKPRRPEPLNLFGGKDSSCIPHIASVFRRPPVAATAGPPRSAGPPTPPSSRSNRGGCVPSPPPPPTAYSPSSVTTTPTPSPSPATPPATC